MRDCSYIASFFAAAQQLVAADTLIEDLLVASFRWLSLRHLSGVSFHPRAAELGTVTRPLAMLAPALA
jgi:hypothetical protein